MELHIERLIGMAHLVPVLARWHHAEWGHLYDAAVWDADEARRELAAIAEGRCGDVTWVAFDGDGRTADDLLGSVTLAATDDLDDFDHLSPWLVSLYVRPDARDCGVGTALVDTLVAHAAGDGIPCVHLFTAGQEAYYAERGWTVLTRFESHGVPAAVMVRSTTR